MIGASALTRAGAPETLRTVLSRDVGSVRAFVCSIALAAFGWASAVEVAHAQDVLRDAESSPSDAGASVDGANGGDAGVPSPIAPEERPSGPADDSTPSTAETRDADPASDRESIESESERSSDDGEPLAEREPDASERGESRSSSRPHWTDARAAAWATFGGSFAVAVLGGILLAVGADDFSAVESAPDGARWADLAERRDRAPVLIGTGGVLAGVGVVGMGIGAAWLAVIGGEGTWLSVAAGADRVVLRGRF